MRKKFSKGFAAVLACVWVIITVVGCGKDNPQKIYEDALMKTNDVSSRDMGMDIKASIGTGETNVDIKLGMDMKVSGLNTDAVKLKADMKLNMLSMDIDMGIYYADGYIYIDSMGKKIKMQDSLDNTKDQIKKQKGMLAFDKDAISDLSVEKDADQQILKFKVKADMIQEVYDGMESALSSAGGSQSLDLSQYNIEFEDTHVEAVINKEGYLISCQYNVPCTVDVGGTKSNLIFDMKVVDNSPGQEVTVEDMDTSEYVEDKTLDLYRPLLE